ncbi:MAG: hypothetical protein HQK65_04340 [Desulfamplus sp.]|nr:hypothetical protein [Desulfamplus sp.]
MDNNKKVVAQVIDFQKNIFDNSFQMMSNIQDQSEQMISKSIEKNPLIPNDTLKICTYWMDLIKKNRKNYKSYIDTNFMKMKDIFKINESADAGTIKKTDKATN